MAKAFYNNQIFNNSWKYIPQIKLEAILCNILFKIQYYNAHNFSSTRGEAFQNVIMYGLYLKVTILLFICLTASEEVLD